MSMNKRKVSLLTYWTRNYVMTLIIGLTILFVISAAWIRHTTTEHRIELMEIIAEEQVERIISFTQEDKPGELPPFNERRTEQTVRDIDPTIYMTNVEGQVLALNRPFIEKVFDFTQLIAGDMIQQVQLENIPYVIVKKELVIDEQLVGYVFAVETDKNITEFRQEFGSLVLVIVMIGLLGWGAIYMLSKRLSKPIMEVAEAAKLVEQGNYDIQLPTDSREKEVDELVTSFKEMVTRLEQLEKTRTELLAGVTHELKTPVTSISGLLQAVNDDVVTGADAKEFIQMALEETTKMKTMVGDLLSFNSFAVDAVAVQLEIIEANNLFGDMVKRWMATRPQVDVGFMPLEQDTLVQVDLVRIQQILVNLLTNAEQAMGEAKQIHVTMHRQDEWVHIEVQDSGTGIPLVEQPFIFERFYRGEDKKYKVRGLGLGLALSKMMAKSMGGDLILKESSAEGTTFIMKLKSIDA